jgi:hypothetical protein
MSLHKNLKDVVEDHLALASMHYLRSHFQEASEIYKQLLLEYREYAALQSHLALCHYKLDFYDIAQEVNSVYLSMYPTSTTGLNLKVGRASVSRVFVALCTTRLRLISLLWSGSPCPGLHPLSAIQRALRRGRAQGAPGKGVGQL